VDINSIQPLQGETFSATAVSIKEAVSKPGTPGGGLVARFSVKVWGVVGGDTINRCVKMCPQRLDIRRRRPIWGYVGLAVPRRPHRLPQKQVMV
jgi:hypothetical protein